MKNSIDAHMDFSFKGEVYQLDSTLDLDQVQDKFITLSSLYQVMAVEHRIDTYSYLYEVMQEAEIHFNNPQGNTTEFLNNGVFDLDGYIAKQGESNLMDTLQAIALRELGIENLEQHPQLKRALTRAYQLGMES